MRLAAALLGLCALGLAHAQDSATTQAELGVTRESLSGGRSDWRSAYLELLHRTPARTTWIGSLRRTVRFDQNDNEAGLEVSVAPARRWTLGLAGTLSDTYRVLPRDSVGVSIGRAFDDGYVLGAALKRTGYRRDDSWLASVTGERYWDNLRASLTIYGARLNAGATAGSQRVAMDLYYADRSRAGLSLARGRELESDGSGGVSVLEVKSAALAGTHWVTAQWGVSWELGWQQQGELYRRTGIRVGLRREL